MMPISRRLIAALIITLTCGVGAAMANSIPPGTLSLSFLNGQGTATGFFIIDPTTGKVTSWNFQLSTGPNYAASTYSSADPTSISGAITLPNTDGDQVVSFVEVQTAQGQVDEFDIVFSCNGVANCVTNAAVGQSFAITVGNIMGTPSCPAGALKCISSGEQLNVPGGLALPRLLAAGFLTVTDPGGLLAFNLDPTGTGGPPPNVPEPSSLLLLGSGLICSFGTLRRRLRLQR
jgi:hypothetical protein